VTTEPLWSDAGTGQPWGSAEWRGHLRPQSEDGRRYALLRQPFRRGEKALWRADRADVQCIVQAVSPLLPLLSQLPQVDGAAELLRQGEQLGQEPLAAIKRFCCLLLAIDAVLRETAATPAFWRPEGVLSTLCTLYPALATGDLSQSAEQWQQMAGFSLADAGDREWEQAFAFWHSARLQCAEAERTYTRELGRLYRAPLRRDGTLMIPLDAAWLAAARDDQRLRRRVETPFEVVFEPVWPSAIDELRSVMEVNQSRLIDAERSLLARLSRQLAPCAEALLDWGRQVGRLDELVARVAMAQQLGCSWSELGDGIVLCGGVHPQVAGCIPVDVRLEHRVTILMGPNMGGKSVTQKTLLLLQACHQYDWPLPGGDTHYAAPLYTAIRYVGGDGQSLQSGLSSFGAELISLQAALQLPHCLLCLDEIARSTNPVEGQALVAAVVAYLIGQSTATGLVATHFSLDVSGCEYMRVKGLREQLEQLPAGLSVPERLARLGGMMDYRWVASHPGDSPQDGLRIARWLGLEPIIVQSALEILARE